MFAGKRFFTAAVSALLLAVTLLAPAAGASDDCQRPHDTQPSETFDVRVSVAGDVYRLGETVRFRVKVMRVLHGQVLGPAEGAEAHVMVDLGDVVLGGRSVTDDRGMAAVKVVLRPDAPTGFADIVGRAHKETTDLPCHSDLEHEFGDVQLSDLFEVVR